MPWTPEPYDKEKESPWAIMRGDDIYWLGMAEDEDHAWTIGLGWPGKDEVEAAKSNGIYAVPVGLVRREG